jgi:hypothetical protein
VRYQAGRCCSGRRTESFFLKKFLPNKHLTPEET